jgi:pimeloyl-ACP methyl ester carboxylesterase
MNASIASALVCGIGCLGGFAASDADAFSPCVLAGEDGPAVAAECRDLEVALAPEQAPGTLTLFVARIRSTHPTPAPDPLLLIAGGPGQAASSLFLALQPAFAPILRDRDVIIVDQRGTGRSRNGLECAVGETRVELVSADAAARLARDCLAGLAADPRWFTSSAAVRDLEQVRLTLGIERWNLYGVSYGTRIAQHYLRRYPKSARALILDGVVPSTLTLGPELGATTAATVTRIGERCRAGPDCSARFGDMAATLRALSARLGSDGVPVTLRHPRDARTLELQFTSPLLMSAVRFLSYRSETAALLPLLIDSASRGDLAPLAAQAQLVSEQLAQELSFPLQAAVICSEDAPAFGARNASPDDAFGLDLLEPLAALCAAWPGGPVDADLKAPLASTHPVLILSGELDPVTPPHYAETAIAQGLSNALHVIGPGQGHGLAPVGCVPRLMRAFLAEPEPLEIDARCVSRLQAAPFFLTFNGPGP